MLYLRFILAAGQIIIIRIIEVSEKVKYFMQNPDNKTDAVNDLWLLLPGSFAESKREFSLLVEGYEDFAGFDYTSCRLIDPLGAMRMIYFLSWCNDYQFRHNFPEWGSDR